LALDCHVGLEDVLHSEKLEGLEMVQERVISVSRSVGRVERDVRSPVFSVPL